MVIAYVATGLVCLGVGGIIGYCIGLDRGKNYLTPYDTKPSAALRRLK